MTRNTTTGRIDPDPTKFPNGIDGLADQIHALGLKMGIYRSVVLMISDLGETNFEWPLAMPARRLAQDFLDHWATRLSMRRHSQSGALTVRTP